jgi:hypothetical protein
MIVPLTKLAEYYSSPGVIREGVMGAGSPQIRAKVVDYYRRAIAIAEKPGGEDQSELEMLLRHFALFCTGNNLHPEASKLHERVLSIVEASEKKDVDMLASALIPLGDAYSSKRRYAEAEAIYKRVQEMA